MNGPTLRAPRGACDCHMHFYGPRDRYPLAPTCPVEPPPVDWIDDDALRSRVLVDNPANLYGF